MKDWIVGYVSDWNRWWNRFWFTPADPAVIGLLRVLAGSMVLYTHAVWAMESGPFFGQQSLIPPTYRSLIGDGPTYFWSHFDWLPSDAWLMPVHWIGLLVVASFVVGFYTRVTGIVTALLVISYANRTTGAQYGLDQINGLLTLYLAIGPSGQYWSLDRYLSRGRGGEGGTAKPSVMANVTLRLIQCHLCVVYLFAGLGKLQGNTWWTGQAIWGALANFEYQTVDLTWLSAHMGLVNVITYSALFWEVTYPFLIWPKLTRPIWLAMAILVHAGIGLTMGMITFGLIMIIANLSFLSPDWVRRVMDRLSLVRSQ